VNKSILILEDDQRLSESLARTLEDHGYQPTIANSIEAIVPADFKFALIDLRLNGEFGLDAIPLIKRYAKSCRIVVLSGYGSIATAVEAVKRGAADYITKPASFHRIELALSGGDTKVKAAFKAPSLAQMEHEYIDFVLTKNHCNISKTAKDLGLHRQSLQRKLKKYTS
jgi:two-component system response regulator RegA